MDAGRRAVNTAVRSEDVPLSELPEWERDWRKRHLDIKVWRFVWSLCLAQPLNAYWRPYRKSFGMSRTIRIRPAAMEKRQESWAVGRYGEPVHPKPDQLWCDTPASACLALWPKLKPPAEQRRLEDCRRLYVGGQDLARRDGSSVWIDENAERATAARPGSVGAGTLLSSSV